MIKGRIHSIESMGLVDGPGIRVVIFFQGCNLRCAYCHNVDTWNLQGGKEITPEELVKKILRFKPYFSKGNGGVTFSGGEPLLQKDFLLKVLKLCRQNHIHTALDTAGCGLGQYDEILKYVDLIILDIKHSTKSGFKELTLRDMEESSDFLKIAKAMKKKFWIRHVVVPGITDREEHIEKLASIIKCIDNVEKIELLPYHLLGINKFKELGIAYRLEGIPPMNKEKTKLLEDKIKSYINKK